MIVATYNVNGINGRLPVLLRWLNEKQPDVACLQELKAPHEKFPGDAINAAGYEYIRFGQKSWNGVAILSKIGMPVERQRGLPGFEHDENSRYIEAVINDVIIGCLYLPNGNPAPGLKFDYKMTWIKHFTAYAEKMYSMQQSVILVGDYNIIPTTADAYKAERWVEDALFLPEVREAYTTLLAQGWQDAIRTLYPKEIIYTFFDYFRDAYKRNAGLRIDHFLLNGPLQQQLVSGGVHHDVRGWEKSSDHAPVWIKVNVP